MKIYSFYTDSHKVLLDDFFLPSIKKEYNCQLVIDKYDQLCETGKLNDKGWIETMYFKIDTILKGINDNKKNNDYFIHSDIDIQFFGNFVKDCEELIKKSNCDILFQKGGRSICMGFFIAKSSEKLKKLFVDVKNEMKKQKENDEQIIKKLLNIPRKTVDIKLNFPNEFKNKYNIKWNYLPENKYINGKKVAISTADNKFLIPPKDTIMHHATNTMGLENKIKQLNYVKNYFLEVKNLFNQTPIIFHFNNGTWRNSIEIKNLIKKMIHNTKKCDNEIDNLDIVTCYNKNDIPMTHKSLNKLNVNYKILGKNIKTWTSNGLKIKLVYDYLKNTDKKYAMHLDGSDVVIIDNPKKVISRFLDYKCKLLFNAENDFYQKIYPPIPENTKLHYDIKKFEDSFKDYSFVRKKTFYNFDNLKNKGYSDVKIKKKKKYYNEMINKNLYFNYLNSGCWIGEREYVLKIFEECMEYYNKNGYSCDQSLMHKKYYKYYPDIKIDYHCNIFQCMNLCNEKDIKHK